ncbi:hypothetical protein T492DRAFT_960389 [Pavlovales sp. CCMP2436]|nr:hypothetical protein T492DRAFT_960389 [Pavlovales sp. CCMP2436]|mmetsp:Transcript_5067/g.13138  ORF Transcript_5067/g.13138 Transcript_5067/m.13138 type:complete len:175 (-) Transcript_5067:225-749(-)
MAAPGGPDPEERVTIRVTWRSMAGIMNGATALFVVSRALKVSQLALLPPPVSVRQAQVDLSENAVGVVDAGQQLDSAKTLDQLLAQRPADETEPINLELMPVALIAKLNGAFGLAPVPYVPSVSTRHMTSVQLVEFLRAHGIEPPLGFNTSRAVLREMVAAKEAAAPAPTWGSR